MKLNPAMITYKNVTILLIVCALAQSCNQKQANTETTATTAKTDSSGIHFPDETHLSNVRQLSFGGDNAEAYWSFDNTMLTFQHSNKKTGVPCDQIFLLNVTDTTRHMTSTGKGRTTCSFFLPGDTQIVYASTHL